MTNLKHCQVRNGQEECHHATDSTHHGGSSELQRERDDLHIPSPDGRGHIQNGAMRERDTFRYDERALRINNDKGAE